jgi:hypothetical protein
VSDRFDAAFESLRGQRPPAPFAPPEAIRRRGRQRTVRQVVAAGFAAFVVLVGGGAAAAVALDRGAGPPYPPGTTPTPLPDSATPSASTGRTTGPGDPAAAFLKLSDLDGGPWRTFPLYEPFESGDRWYWGNILCPAYHTADYQSLSHLEKVATQGFESSGAAVHQHVTRYAPGWGGHALTDSRQAVNTCAGSAPPNPSTPLQSHYTVLDTGFAGDAALLIRETTFVLGPSGEPPTATTNLVVIVRVGDLLTLLHILSPADEAFARRLAIKAATRLRTG